MPAASTVSASQKGAFSKTCDLLHSQTCLVSQSMCARRRTTRVGPLIRPIVGGSLWGVTRSGPFFSGCDDGNGPALPLADIEGLPRECPLLD